MPREGRQLPEDRVQEGGEGVDCVGLCVLRAGIMSVCLTVSVCHEIVIVNARWLKDVGCCCPYC